MAAVWEGEIGPSPGLPWLAFAKWIALESFLFFGRWIDGLGKI